MRKRSDVTKFRTALKAVGFHYNQAAFYNDKRKTCRRLKLQHADGFLRAPQSTKDEFVRQLQNQFGDRLISAQPHEYRHNCWGTVKSVVVTLKD